MLLEQLLSPNLIVSVFDDFIGHCSTKAVYIQSEFLVKVLLRIRSGEAMKAEENGPSDWAAHGDQNN